VFSDQLRTTIDDTDLILLNGDQAYSSGLASDTIVGNSSQLKSVLHQVSLVAPTEATVLILGETGTGKELIARTLHERSRRSSRPFIRVNCAAIPASLISSELFGHEKGAFTGALQRRLGRFEAANSGTIFLDEIGELPMETQITLLRVLQEREFERVGSSQSISVNVRNQPRLECCCRRRDVPAGHVLQTECLSDPCTCPTRKGQRYPAAGRVSDRQVRQAGGQEI